MTLATPPFGKIFGVRVRTMPGKTCVKFEVRSFNRFWTISILTPPWPAAAHRHTRTHTHTNTKRHTSNERIISAIHFVHLAEIKTSWTLLLCAVEKQWDSFYETVANRNRLWSSCTPRSHRNRTAAKNGQRFYVIKFQQGWNQGCRSRF